ncbi:MAG: hypothetical protein AAGN66_26165 [Acidobacteriota bacterium]
MSVGVGLGLGAVGSRLLTSWLDRGEQAAEGFGDLVPWGWLVGDGTLLNTNGSFTTAFTYRGPDLSSLDPDDRVSMERSVAEAVGELGGWIVNVDLARRRMEDYAGEGAFPTPALRALDEERRRAFTRGGGALVTEAFLTLTWRPAALALERMGQWFVSGELQVSSPVTKAQESFEEAVERFGRRLRGPLRLERLDGPGLLRWLRWSVTGEPQNVQVPRGLPAWVNAHVVDQDVLGGMVPRVGERWIGVVGVSGYPRSVPVQGVDFLHRLGFPLRSSHRLLVLSAEASRSVLREERSAWMKKRRDLLGLVSAARDKGAADARSEEVFENLGAWAMARDVQSALGRLETGEFFGRYTWAVVVTDPDRALVAERTREVAKAVGEQGFGARIERLNAMAAYCGSLPGVGACNVRRPLLGGEELSQLVPLSGAWLGRATCPSPLFPPASPPVFWARRGGAVPFRFHLHEGDVGHALVLGRTGGGKTVFLSLLAAQWLRYPGGRVVFFDAGRTGELLSLAADGRHVDLRPGRGISLQPLAGIDVEAERAWVLSWLETLFALQGLELSGSERNHLREAVTDLAREDVPFRTLTELRVHLPERLQEALDDYCHGGAFGGLFDAGEDLWADEASRVWVFEMEGLVEAGPRVAGPAWAYLTHRLGTLFEEGAPTLVIIDEAFLMLGDRRFAGYVERLLRQGRKKNVAVVLATQTLEEIAEGEMSAVLLRQCLTRVLLPDSGALSSDVDRAYEALGVSRSERRQIADAQAKRHYFVKSPSGSALVDLELGEMALALLTPPPGLPLADGLERLRTAKATGGEDWHLDLIPGRGRAA